MDGFIFICKVWAVETVSAGWCLEDEGGRINTVLDLQVTEGDDWQ